MVNGAIAPAAIRRCTLFHSFISLFILIQNSICHFVSDIYLIMFKRIKKSGRSLLPSNTTYREQSMDQSKKDLPYPGRNKPVISSCPEGTGESELSNPSGITIHPISSNLYISDTKNRRIQIYDPDGVFISTFASSPLMCDPCGIRIVADRVYVTQNPGHYITVFQEDGSLISTFGREGGQPAEFNHPYDIDVDQTNGDIYICDMDNGRLQIFTQDFELKTMFAFDYIKRPHNVKVINRELYILNQSQQGELIYFCEHAMSVKKICTNIVYPIGFDIDKNGNFLILEYYTRKSITILSRDGVFLQRIEMNTSMPRSISVDGQGRILVVCGTNGQSENCLYVF